jgi:uncharacterized membrane protein
VQLSPWSRVAGLEVSLIGVVGYTVLTAVSLAALQPALSSRRWPVQLLSLLAGAGVAFTIYLTYLELFVIHAICRWCVGSGVIIVAILVATLLDQRRLSRIRTA